MHDHYSKLADSTASDSTRNDTTERYNLLAQTDQLPKPLATRRCDTSPKVKRHFLSQSSSVWPATGEQSAGVAWCGKCLVPTRIRVSPFASNCRKERERAIKVLSPTHPYYLPHRRSVLLSSGTLKMMGMGYLVGWVPNRPLQYSALRLLLLRESLPWNSPSMSGFGTTASAGKWQLHGNYFPFFGSSLYSIRSSWYFSF